MHYTVTVDNNLRPLFTESSSSSFGGVVILDTTFYYYFTILAIVGRTGLCNKFVNELSVRYDCGCVGPKHVALKTLKIVQGKNCKSET